MRPRRHPTRKQDRDSLLIAILILLVACGWCVSWIKDLFT
jgi:hypothetical protein